MFWKIIIKRITKFWYEYNAFGRIFWTVTLTLSTIGMAIFSYYVVHKYQYDPVSIIVETDFIHWNISFPAVSVCLVAGTKTPLQLIIDALNITVTESFLTLSKDLKPCIFSNPNYLTSSIVKCHEILSENGLTVEDVKEAILTRDCHDIVEYVVYDDEYYNCSEILKFHLTERGYCFIINSIIDSDYSYTNLKLRYNIETNNKTLSLRLKTSKLWKYVIFVHSPEELPSENVFSYDVGRANSVYSFNIVPILTDVETAKIPTDLRKCRFPLEKFDNYPIHYSFSTCINYLRIQLELQHCNCTFSSAPEKYRSQYCDAKGIACLVNGNFYKKACQLAMDENICIPPCSEQLLTYVGQSDGRENAEYAEISIEIPTIPLSRYRRTLTRSALDLAVSIAGLAGLFFGASVLNFVELLYYMIKGN